MLPAAMMRNPHIWNSQAIEARKFADQGYMVLAPEVCGTARICSNGFLRQPWVTRLGGKTDECS